MFLTSLQSSQTLQTNVWEPSLARLKRRRKDCLLLILKCNRLRVNPCLATLQHQLGASHGLSFSSSHSLCTDIVYLQSLCEQGELDEALAVLFRMEGQGRFPSVEVYRRILKACAQKRALTQVKRVHASLAKHGLLDSTHMLAEDMVRTLVACGSLEEGLHAFRRLCNPTVLSWTALISGYHKAGRYQEALEMYHWMQEQGVHPNTFTFIPLLSACGSMVDLVQGKQMHAEAFRCRCTSDLFVGTCLVDMYTKCGSILDANIVFDELPQRDVVVWTTMLAAYLQQRQPDKVLQLYAQLQDEGVSSDGWVLVNALQACGMRAESERNVVVAQQVLRVESLQKGMHIHAEAWRTGFKADMFVGNAIVSMYVKCGSLVLAQMVFDVLPERDVVSWNTMIAGYVHQDLAEEALELYDKMPGGVSPDARTFVSILQACGHLADEEKGVRVGKVPLKLIALGKAKIIHCEAWRRGYASNSFIFSALVSLYGKCGSIVDAQISFGRCPPLNVVSWNAMLMAFAHQGEADKAFQLYEQMLEEGVSPDDRTFDGLLQACGVLAEDEEETGSGGQLIRGKCLQLGKEIHAEAWTNGYLTDLFVSSSLVSTLGKCGSTADAQHVFDGLLSRDRVVWNALQVAYTQQSEWEKALQLYEKMLQEGVSPDDGAFVTALQCCGMLAESRDEDIGDECWTKSTVLAKGKVVHAEAWKRGYRSDVFVASALVSMYGKWGSTVDAQQMFDEIRDRDVVLWSAMLSVHAQQQEPSKTVQLYMQMRQEGTSPDDRTFVGLLQACATIAEEEEVDQHSNIRWRALQMGMEVHAEAWKRRYTGDAFISNALISMYSKCGSISSAEDVFHRLSKKDVAVWNVMLAAYVFQDQAELALQLYRKLQEEGVSADEGTTVCVLQACCKTGRLDTCAQVHHSLVSSGNHLSPLLASTLIHAYGRFARMVEAQRVFDELTNPDLVSWNALMAGYARQGNCAATLQAYKRMQSAGVRPDGITLLSILSACSHAGLVSEGLEHFYSIIKNHDVVPTVEHYVSMVDLFGRAGYFSIVEDLLAKMPIHHNLSMWLCLLGSCQKHGRVDLGQLAFDRAVHLQPRQAAAYVLMSNIYAQAGMWDCVEKVNERRQQAGAWKKPGYSWVEHGLVMHIFSVRHQQPELTHFLDELRLREEGRS